MSMVSGLSKAQEGVVSLLTGAAGAVVAAWIYWSLFHEPICEPDFFTGSLDCVITLSGESRTWPQLAASPDAVVLGFIFAGVVYLILELMIEAAKRSERPH